MHDLTNMRLKFCKSLKYLAFCHVNTNIIVPITQPGKEPKEGQRKIENLQNKIVRQIRWDGEDDFVIATAESQDKDIELIHSSDPEKEIKIPIRFSEKLMNIADIFVEGNYMKTLITRDDEEIYIHHFANFQ